MNNIQGWITDKEGRLLRNLSGKCRGRGVILEIGSLKGRSTAWLTRGTKQKVYALDTFMGFYDWNPESEHYYHKVIKDKSKLGIGFKEFWDNMEAVGIEKQVVPIINYSSEAVKTFDKPIELLFIDGGHDYHYIKEDLAVWLPKIVNGGVVAVHDVTSWAGVRKAVIEEVYKSRRFQIIGVTGSILYARKMERSGFMKNWFALLSLYVRVFYFQLKKLYIEYRFQEDMDKRELAKMVKLWKNEKD